MINKKLNKKIVKAIENKPLTYGQIKKKIGEVFKELEKDGIKGECEMGDCQTCGNAEMDDLYKNKWRGYVFYHEQDADELKDNRSCFLSYGPFNNNLEPRLSCAEVGRKIKEMFLKYKVKVDWDDNEAVRICIDFGK